MFSCLLFSVFVVLVIIWLTYIVHVFTCLIVQEKEATLLEQNENMVGDKEQLSQVIKQNNNIFIEER